MADREIGKSLVKEELFILLLQSNWRVVEIQILEKQGYFGVAGLTIGSKSSSKFFICHSGNKSDAHFL